MRKLTIVHNQGYASDLNTQLKNGTTRQVGTF